jgi:hypothetical protein
MFNYSLYKLLMSYDSLCHSYLRYILYFKKFIKLLFQTHVN